MTTPQLQDEFDRLYKPSPHKPTELNDLGIYIPPALEPEPVVWPWVVVAYVVFGIVIFAIFAYVAHVPG